MSLVRNLVCSIARGPITKAELLRTTPLTSASLCLTDIRVPITALYKLIDRALDLTNDQALGLHCVERLSSQAFNPISALVLHAETWQQAMASVLDFSGLLADSAGFCIEDRKGKLVMSNDGSQLESLRVRRFLSELIYGALFKAVQRYRAEKYVEAVSFDYPAPEYVSEYNRAFKGLARFEQMRTSMQVDSELMRVAGPHPDEELCSVLRGLARQRLLQRDRQRPYSSRVYQILVWQESPYDLRMSSIARQFGVCERTLRRHLIAEGNSYADILRVARGTLAKHCLQDESRTVAETARELGLSRSGFYRAFKRWTGITPTEYRRQLSQ